jgi:hypothetical protein
VVVNLEKFVFARTIFGDLARDAQYRDAPGNAVNPQQIQSFDQPYKGAFQIIQSPLIFQRLTDVGITTPGYYVAGMGLNRTTAGKYWWMAEKGKALKYMQNWPLRVQQATPGQVDMIDRGVVLFVKADERGIPMWYEPRRAVRCKP